MLARNLIAAAGNAGAEPVYVEDVFETQLYTNPSTTPPTAPLGVVLTPGVGLLAPENVDPDWAYVKRYLPLDIGTRSWDFVTNTAVYNSFVGGIGVAGPFGNTGIAGSYILDQSGSRMVSYTQPSGAAWNSSWCIEAWTNLYAYTNDQCYMLIHAEDFIDGSTSSNSVHFYQYGQDGSSSIEVQIRRNGTLVANWSYAVSMNAWHFSSLSYNGSTLYLHIDGVLKNSVSFTGWTTVPTHWIYMGGYAVAYNTSLRGLLTQYRLSFGTARTSTRTTVPTRPFGITDATPNCEDALLWYKTRNISGNHYLQTLLNASMLSDSPATYDQNTGYATDTTLRLPAYAAGGDQDGNRRALWIFKKQPKFFDIVYYTGTGSANTIAHNLGSAPGCIIVKRLQYNSSPVVYHSGLTSAAYYMLLNDNGAQVSNSTVWNSTSPTSSVFSVGTNSYTNASGGSYVAYIFASDAGGFGSSDSENIIKCGSYTGTGSANNFVNLGFEPQWLLVKHYNSSGNSWRLYDSMRGFAYGFNDSGDRVLYPNQSAAEASGYLDPVPNATGFTLNATATSTNGNGDNYIYIAIRRPMKTPESGTEVFYPTGNSLPSAIVTTGFPSDMVMQFTNSLVSTLVEARIISDDFRLQTSSSGAESTGNSWDAFSLSSMNLMTQTYFNSLIANAAGYAFKRAPVFFDVVCYTGTGVSGLQIAHNLTVTPEMMIVKRRDASGSWTVYSATLGATKNLYLDSPFSQQTIPGKWNNTAPTDSVFTVGNESSVNSSSGSYVAYLFATLAGISKVGSYTGTATTLQINCGFSAGARFVLIKRTDSSGDWYVWDSARGIVAGNDPYFLLNEAYDAVTNTDYIDPYSAGFEITSTAPAAINASGGTFIYFAIA